MTTPLGTTDPAVILAVAWRAATQGDSPSAGWLLGCRELAPALGTLPLEVVRRAMGDILRAPHVELGLEVLHLTGALAAVLPEVEATIGFSQEGGRRHKDVWAHTKTVVSRSPPTPVLRWAALFHDVGKVRTRRFHPDGTVSFHRHEAVGARMFDTISRRMAFPEEESFRVRFLVLMHLRANAYAESWTDAAVRRLDRELGEHLDDLLALSAADVTSSRPGRRDEATRNLAALHARILRLRQEEARPPLLPPGLGQAIMEAFGLPPSPTVGRLRQRCLEGIEQGLVSPGQEAEHYVAFLGRGMGLLDKP